MTFDEYQQKAAEFAVYPKDREREYLSLGLISEVGELAGKLKKEIRDGVDLTEAILAEIGDCLWYLSQITFTNSVFVGITIDPSYPGEETETNVLKVMADLSCRCTYPSCASAMLDYIAWLCCRRGTTFEAVCEANIAKLTDRKNRGKLQGSGDTR